MLCNKIKAVIRRYEMLGDGDRVLVAFSGGADSVALLYFLKAEGYAPSAIHVNHGIRGEEADGDEDFCRCFCRDHSIPFFSVKLDVPGEAKASGEGMEEAARRLRYSEIDKLMQSEGFDKAATAHHADDNMETVLFNLTRGSGIRGAAGIPPIRDRYIRPLIDCTRDDILGYCRDNSLEFVTDSTNLDTDYTRNFIRHRVSPLIKRINPDAASAFGRFSEFARRDDELLCTMAADISADADRATLAALHDSLLVRYIYLRCDEYSLTPASKAAVQLIQAIRSGNDYKCVDMGSGIKAVCDRQSVRLIREGEDEIPALDKTALKPGENDLGIFGRIYIAESREQAEEFENIYKISINTRLKFDKIKDNLFARSRRDGDSYRSSGMTKSLKKLYNSRKLGVRQRNLLPLICDSEGIVWIPGFAPCDRVKSGREDKDILYIGYKG